MRRLIAVAALTACASAGAPPGGPERKEPPAIVSITPDSGTTAVNTRSVLFTFDEVVSDRPGGGKTDLNQLFLISPSDGTPRVNWHRSSIEVRPRNGFQRDRAYAVTLLPGLTDLRGNVLKTARTIVFSTGGAIPPFSIPGRAFDWAAERPMVGAYVEAISLPDSLRYLAVSDTSGQFDVGPLGPGTYLVRAILDQNNNRVVDRNEKWDSVRVTVATARRPIELDLIERDSMPPFIRDVTPQDSVTLRITFDKPLDPTLALAPSLVTIQRTDSTPLTVVTIITQQEADRRRVIADSIRQDSTRRADSVRTAAQRPPGAPPVNPPVAGPVPVARPTPPPPPKPRAPAPPIVLVVQLLAATPLTPGQSYRVTVRGARNLAHVSTREPLTGRFIVPRPPPADTTHKAPTDTTRKPPPRPPPGHD